MGRKQVEGRVGKGPPQQGLSEMGELETLGFCGLQLAISAAFAESDTAWSSAPGQGLPMSKEPPEAEPSSDGVPVLLPQVDVVAM